MLSYQHGYHAGSRADVHKHAALAVLLEALSASATPVTYAESHAGRGLYDLASPEALKTREAEKGIIPLLAAGGLPEGHPYARAISLCRERHGGTTYPGSPLMAQLLLRRTDHFHLMELHPQEHAALRASLRGPNVDVHKRDGLEALLAIAPPRPRQGLVFIDPSYEVKTEFEAVGDAAVRLREKWPEASILVWHPLLQDAPHEPLLRLLGTAPGPVWTDEMSFPAGQQRALGSGLVCLNPPSGLEDRLGSRWISAALA